MRAKRAREIRQTLGMTTANLRNPEYNYIQHPKRIAYFRDSLGQLVAKNTERFTLINTSKNYYRKVKKAYKRGK